MALKTRAQALRDLGVVIAEVAARTDHLTPREAAERAWESSSSVTVDELADTIAVSRGLTAAGP